MIERLISRFVKNSRDTKSPSVRQSYGLLMNAVDMICGLISFSVKFICGFIVGSVSVRADAFNDLSDVITVFLNRMDARLLKRNPEEAQNTGMHRFRNVTAFIAAFLVFEVGFSYMSRCLSHFTRPWKISPSLPVLILLILMPILRGWLGTFQATVGRRINSKIFLKNAKRTKNDNIITVISILPVACGLIFHINLDCLTGVIIAATVIKSAFVIAIDLIRPSIEKDEDPELAKQVRERVHMVNCIVGIGTMKIREYGDSRRVVSVHTKVPREYDFDKTHTIIEEAEKQIGGDLGITLIIHIDPMETKNREALIAYSRIERELDTYDTRVSFDNFHLVRGTDFSNLIFDLFVPVDYTADDIKAVMDLLRQKMKELNPRYACVISVEQA